MTTALAPITDEELSVLFGSPQYSDRFPPILTPQQAADLLQVKTATIYEWRARHLLDSCCSQRGRRPLLLRDRLIRWYFDGQAEQPPPGDNSPPSLPRWKGTRVRLRRRSAWWYASWNDGGRNFRRTLRTKDEQEAIARALKLEEQLKHPGRDEKPVETSIDTAVDAYLNYLETEGRAKRTMGKYRYTFRQVRKLAHGRNVRMLSQLDLVFVDAYRKMRKDKGRAPKTIHNETTTIKQLINFALSRDLLDRNPLKGLKLKKLKPTPQPFWTADQVERIVAAMGRSPYYPVYRLLSETGMRIAEAKFLTWSDVDLEQKLLFIREKRFGPKKSDVWKPKSGDQRVVPLSTRMVEVLKQLPNKCRWVFIVPARTGQRQWRQINDRSVLTQLKKVLKQLGLPGHVHTFRHSFISHALTRGVPEAIVRQWVGHVDRDILAHYTHIADAVSKAQMERLFSRPEDVGAEASKGAAEATK